MIKFKTEFTKKGNIRVPMDIAELMEAAPGDTVVVSVETEEERGCCEENVLVPVEFFDDAGISGDSYQVYVDGDRIVIEGFDEDEE